MGKNSLVCECGKRKNATAACCENCWRKGMRPEGTIKNKRKCPYCGRDKHPDEEMCDACLYDRASWI